MKIGHFVQKRKSGLEDQNILKKIEKNSFYEKSQFWVVILFVMKIRKNEFLSKMIFFELFFYGKRKSSFVICYDYIFTSRSSLPFHFTILVLEFLKPILDPTNEKFPSLWLIHRYEPRAKNNIWLLTKSALKKISKIEIFDKKFDSICTKNTRLEVRKE